MITINIHIRRLSNNEYALAQSHKRMKVALKEREEKEIYANIGELLLWIMTTDKWHEENNNGYRMRSLDDKEGRNILGLRYSYNLMKHNMDFYKIHEVVGGVSFPITFPLIIPKIEIVWSALDDAMLSGFSQQANNYKKYLQGQNIIDVFDMAINFLDRESLLMKNKF